MDDCLCELSKTHVPEGKVEFLEHMEACLHRIQDYRCMRLKSHKDFRVGMVEFLEDLEDYVVIRKNSGRIWRSSGPKQLTIIRIVGGGLWPAPTMLSMAYLDFALDIFYGFCSNFLKTGTPIEVTPLVVFYLVFFRESKERRRGGVQGKAKERPGRLGQRVNSGEP